MKIQRLSVLEWRYPDRLQFSLLLVVCLGLLLRFFRLHEPQLWLDELIQLVHFSQPNLRENLLLLSRQIAVAPLDYLVQSLFVAIWGPWEFGARFHAAFFGSLSIPCLFAVGKRMLGRRAAIFSSLLLSLYPLHVFYSREGRNYSLLCFLTLLSFLLLLVGLDQGGTKTWVLFGVTTVLLLYTNYLACLIPAAQVVIVTGIYWFPSLGRGLGVDVKKRGWLGFVPASLFAFLVFLPWLLWTVERAWFHAAEDFLAVSFWIRGLKELSGGSLPLSLLLTLVAGWGAYQLWKQQKAGVLFFLAAWLLLPGLGVLFLDWWRGYFFAIRQILFTVPALLLLVAAGVEQPGQLGPVSSRWLRVGILAIAAALSLGALLLSDRKEQDDWKSLVRYLEQTGASELIAAPQLEGVLMFRYPDLRHKKVDLEGLWRRVSEPEPGETERAAPNLKVHLIQSRFLLPGQSEKVESILAASTVLKSSTMPGFNVHLLSIPGSVKGTL